MAIAKDSGTVSGTTATTGIVLKDNFTLSLIGTAVGDIERSLDGGSTYGVVEAFSGDVERNGFEPLNDVLYRLNPTSGSSAFVLGR